jgi:hypothetical protein
LRRDGVMRETSHQHHFLGKTIKKGRMIREPTIEFLDTNPQELLNGIEWRNETKQENTSGWQNRWKQSRSERGECPPDVERHIKTSVRSIEQTHLRQSGRPRLFPKQRCCLHITSSYLELSDSQKSKSDWSSIWHWSIESESELYGYIKSLIFDWRHQIYGQKGI